MAYEFKLPDLGEGLTEGEIVQWLVKEGDYIEEGQVFVKVETDKAVLEIPSPRKGTVLRTGAAEGEAVQVGQVILVIGEEGEKADPLTKPERAERRASVGIVGELEEAPEEERVREVAMPVPPGKRIEVLAMPAVRKLAQELKVDLTTIKGSGPQGRVTREDVQRASEIREEEKPPEKAVKAARKYDMYGYVERLPLRGMRKTIARAMVRSKYTAPHVTAMDEADVTRLVALREREKERAAAKGIHLTYIPFVIKAVVAGLEEHPYVNASGTFTITNYGAVGGIYGSPIINYPEVAILGLGRIQEKLAVVEGRIEIRKMLPLSLSFDHRVVDGAEAARFLNTVIDYLEDPDLILLEA